MNINKQIEELEKEINEADGISNLDIEDAKLQLLKELKQQIKEEIDKLDCKGKTHGFRPKWIDAEELKQNLGVEE